MKHWFYDENGEERRVWDFTFEQKKQFLFESGYSLTEIGDELTKDCKVNLHECSLKFLLEEANKLGVPYEDIIIYSDSYYEDQYVYMYHQAPAKQEDIDNEVERVFNEQWCEMKQEYKDFHKNAVLFGFTLVERTK